MKHTSLQMVRDEHASLTAMLQSTRALVERGPGDSPQQFFDVLRATLFYIDEFPARLHHTKESELLFPRVLRAAPELNDVVARLDHDHQNAEREVRELQHLLLGWELLGEARMAAFVVACQHYLNFYLEHMRMEEDLILPQAERLLTDADWRELDAAFKENTNPLGGKYPRNPAYDRLFTRIALKVREPMGQEDV